MTGKTQTQTRKIIIKTDASSSKEVRKFSKEFGNMNKEIKKTNSTLSSFRNTLVGLFAGFGIVELANASDEFQLLSDRMKVFSSDAVEAEQGFEKIVKAARFARTSVSSLGETYNRIALATQELGLSQDAMLGTTLALQQTFRISGATIAEASAAAIQLSQGLSSGQLRGQELRSVMEQNAVFAGILSKELGITRGQLIKFAESGKITSDVVLKALSKNFDDINRQAEKLSITFGQAATIAFDAFKKGISDLNKEFGISSAFAKGLLFVVDNFSIFAQSMVAFVTGAYIPRLTAQLIALNKAVAAGSLINLAKSGNLLAIALGALAAGSAIVIDKLNDPKYQKTQLEKSLGGVRDRIKELQAQIKVSSIVPEGADAERFYKIQNQGIEKARMQIKALQRDEENLLKKISLVNKELAKTDDSFDVDPLGKALKDAADNMNIVNTQFGKFVELNKLFASGAISEEDYKKRFNAQQIEEINKKFREGKIDLFAYRKELEKFQELGFFDQGIKDYVDSIGTLNANLAGLVSNTFKSMEDSLFDFVKKGKFSFADFTKAVMDDLLRIIIRMSVIQPIAQSLGAVSFGGSSLPSGTTTTSAVPTQSFATVAAQGHGFSNGQIQAFARGGLVDSPTMFNYGNGKTGLMGEAGTEAIMPLKRTPSGDLGVNASGMGSNVTVNVINNGDNEVTTEERTNSDGSKTIDVMVTKIVKDGFSKGFFDRQLKTQYGLNRRGV